MKMTLNTLREFTHDPEYRRLPREMALCQTEENDPWSLLAERLAVEGGRQTVWNICQLVAILFDTYESTLPGVLISVNARQDANDSYLNFSAQIHDQWSHSNTVGPNSMVIDVWKKMGDMSVMKDVLTEIEGLEDVALISQVVDLKRHFSKVFTSAHQARMLAQSVAPQINAWARAQLLNESAKAAVSTGARSGAAGLKF